LLPALHDAERERPSGFPGLDEFPIKLDGELVWRDSAVEMRRLPIFVVAVGIAAGSGVALATLKPLPLSARVIQHGEFLGFGPFGLGGNTTLYKSAKRWVGVNTGLTPAQASAQSRGCTGRASRLCWPSSLAR